MHPENLKLAKERRHSLSGYVKVSGHWVRIHDKNLNAHFQIAIIRILVPIVSDRHDAVIYQSRKLSYTGSAYLS